MDDTIEKQSEDTSSITNAPISQEMKRSYLNYAMSVIVSRALPDVRDGLKPVHRRILYAMYDIGLTHSARFSKSAKVVGEVLGKYHPHGDSPVYDALVRMAQTFSMRYPLVNGQGNFGSIDGDPPAAMRYTEVKLTKIAEELLMDIRKETVQWQDNFDGTIKEPMYMPAKLPNLLLMGAEGIAVGMATKIPPHNLTELVDGICLMIEKVVDRTPTKGTKSTTETTTIISYSPPTQSEMNPFEKKKQDEETLEAQHIDFDITLDDLMKHVKGPDFPTGASIYGAEEIRQMYATGKGKILIRAIVDTEEIGRGKDAIVITELPYQTNKAHLVAKIADLVRDKKIQGISDLRDESDRDGIRVVIELKKDAAYNKVLNNLYKHTELQTTYPANMVALVSGQPQTVSLRIIFESYLKHRIDVIKKRSLHELASARLRAHILEGLLKALDHIDEIIAIIKKSANEPQAKTRLMEKFDFSDLQAQAILDMQLKRLTGLERGKIEEELKKLQSIITELEILLKSVMAILSKIKQELLTLKKDFGDGRKTRIFKHQPGRLTDEQLIENKEVIITLTDEGYIKSVPRETFKVQNRGGKGVAGFMTKDEDNVSYIASAMTHDSVLFFTNLGRVYQIRCWEIPQGTRTSKGKALINILSLAPQETITSMLAYDSTKEVEEKSRCILMCTKAGVVKKTELVAFANIRSSGIIAIRLDGDDRLQWVQITNGKDHIVIATRHGKSIVFNEDDVRPTGRSSRGVMGIRLDKGDEVSSMDSFDRSQKDLKLLVLSKNGIGKKTKISQFPQQKRGGKGVKIANLDERTGMIAFSSTVHPNRETLVITSKHGQVVKIPVKTIPTLSRTAKGVIVMRFSKSGDTIVSATFL